MAKLRNDIEAEDKLQTDLTVSIKERSVLLATLKSSFQHTLDVLRHVGDVHTAQKQRYTNPDLSLPLLKFTAFAPRSHPPKTFENDGFLFKLFIYRQHIKVILFAVGIIQQLLKSRVQQLMEVFDANNAEELAIGTKVYHDAVLLDMQDEEADASKLIPDQSKLLSNYFLSRFLYTNYCPYRCNQS